MECNALNAMPAEDNAGETTRIATLDDSSPIPSPTFAKQQQTCVAHAPRKPSTSAAQPSARATPTPPTAPRSETPFRPKVDHGGQQEPLPVLMSKEQRRHALCMQITEAARYQREFYSPEGRPKDILQVVKKNSVTQSNAAIRLLPALRVKKLTAAAPRGGFNSYMMLSDAALSALLRDVNLLLGAEVEKDYTPDVLNQVWGLKLYQPSVYPMFPPAKPTVPVSSSGKRRPSL